AGAQGLGSGPIGHDVLDERRARLVQIRDCGIEAAGARVVHETVGVGLPGGRAVSFSFRLVDHRAALERVLPRSSRSMIPTSSAAPAPTGRWRPSRWTPAVVS